MSGVEPGEHVVIDLTDEVAIAAALEYLGFDPDHHLALADALREAGQPVEQAEPEAAGYHEPDTGAFVGNRRDRWVGPWEEA